MNEQEIKEFESKLGNFYGTESYHKLTFTDLLGTDGIKFLCENAKCFWLMDIVGSVMYKTKNEPFLIWRIVKTDNKAVVSCYTDSEQDGSYSDSKKVYSQNITYTDFPLNEFEFYQQGNVVMLKGEY